MEPTARSPKSHRSPLRRYLPFIAGITVLALVIAGISLSRKSDATKPKARPAVASTGPGPVTLSDANRTSIDWGPNCDTKRGSVAIPLSYAPPCVKPFRGDNGGATAPGVTADSITIALYQAQPDILQEAALNRSGSDESLATEAQTVQAYIDFFQAHYETYGRKVNLVIVKGSGSPDDDASARADAIKVATEVKAFASFGGPGQTEAYAQELAARGVLCLGDCMLASSQKFVDQRQPNIWLTLPAVDQSAIHWAKFVNGLSGQRAAYAGDTAMTKKQRVFGLVRFDESFAGFQEAGTQFLARLRADGVKVAVDAPYELDLTRAQENARNTIAKLKSHGVTTVMFAGDPLTPSTLTTEATAQKYFPEWIVLGAAYSDTSLFGRTYDPAQWKHAFGVTSLYVPTPQKLDQYSEILRWETGKPPEAKTYKLLVQAPLIFFTALHLAGPRLTPESFKAGLFHFPSAPTDPSQIHFSWGNHDIWPTTDYFGGDDATVIWWDPNATGIDEVGNEGRGMWQFANGGRRYLPTQWPATAPKLFVAANSVTRFDRFPSGSGPPTYPSPAAR
ncbi:MAG: hypothetical protein JJE46_01360 [Acidimicrobiia bacterium]|nr:hypothetical protein [Acidimicrobiia bacterium]